MQQQLADLSAVLGSMPPGQLAELVAREPLLMSLPVEAVGRRYRQMAQGLGLFADDVMDIVRADPSVLTASTDDNDSFFF